MNQPHLLMFSDAFIKKPDYRFDFLHGIPGSRIPMENAERSFKFSEPCL
jgi:hypothetical protein